MANYNPIDFNKFNQSHARYVWDELSDPNKYTLLSNGEYLITRYGKYQPGIVFLINEDNIDMDWERDMSKLKNPLNIRFNGHPEFMYGDFWISRKGSTCFRPNPSGEHILIRNSWGGCFDSTRGTEYEEISEDALYCRRARSNGGGCGNNYYVFRADFKKTVDLDEI